MQATRVRQPAFDLLHLRLGLVADDRLEVAHQRRIGMRTRDCSDAVERVVHVGDPVAQRLVHGVLQRARARLHRDHRCAQHLHADDVGLLPLDVDGAHIDHAFEAEARAQRRGGDTVLAGAGLGDDALLAHAPRQHDLAEHVVHLVRTGVVELFALQVNLGAAEMLGETLGEIERRGPADIVLEIAVHLGLEGRIGLGRGVGLFQIEDQRHQGFGNEASAENAEMAALVGSAAVGIWFGNVHRTLNCCVARAARMKALISSGSLMPGALSTPEDTSAPPAPVTRRASATLPA